MIWISNDNDCPWVVRLFERDSWASADDLHLAVVNYVEEVAAQLSGPTTTGRHDPFWSRQRIRFLSELCRLESMAPEHFDFFAQDMSALTHNDALVALLARIEAFLDFIGEKSPVPEPKASKPLSGLRQDLKEQGFESAAELFRAERIVTAYSKLPHLAGHPKARALTLFLANVLKQARQEKRTNKPKTLLDAFAETLEPSSRERLLKLVEQFWRIPDVTRGCIEADLRGIVQSFQTGTAKTIFRAVAKHEISIEEVIDRGLIMVIDLPVAESGNASLPALVALKLAITQRLIGRYKSLYKSRPLSRRGVLIVQDEAQVLLSDLEAKALSVVREFGVVWLLATQSLSLIASVLRSQRDTEAFVAAARVRIFGATSDEYTAEVASRLCGRSPSVKQRAACLWHPTEELEAAVATSRPTETPLVPPYRFFELQTGQFYVRTAGNHCYLLDLHFDLPAPRAQVLSPGHAQPPSLKGGNVLPD